MTKERATAEMKYQFGKHILQVLVDAEITTTYEAIKVKAELLEKYNPLTRCLEDVKEWQTEL